MRGASGEASETIIPPFTKRPVENLTAALAMVHFGAMKAGLLRRVVTYRPVKPPTSNLLRGPGQRFRNRCCHRGKSSFARPENRRHPRSPPLVGRTALRRDADTRARTARTRRAFPTVEAEENIIPVDPCGSNNRQLTTGLRDNVAVREYLWHSAADGRNRERLIRPNAVGRKRARSKEERVANAAEHLKSRVYAPERVQAYFRAKHVRCAARQ